MAVPVRSHNHGYYYELILYSIIPLLTATWS